MSEHEPDYLDFSGASNNEDALQPVEQKEKGNAPPISAIAEDRETFTPPRASRAANRNDSDTSSTLFTPTRQISGWSASRNSSATK
jgi:hypothetical protein